MGGAASILWDVGRPAPFAPEDLVALVPCSSVLFVLHLPFRPAIAGPALLVLREDAAMPRISPALIKSAHQPRSLGFLL